MEQREGRKMQTSNIEHPTLNIETGEELRDGTRTDRPPVRVILARFGFRQGAKECAPAILPGFRSSLVRRAAIYDASFVHWPVFVNHKIYSSNRITDGRGIEQPSNQ